MDTFGTGIGGGGGQQTMTGGAPAASGEIGVDPQQPLAALEEDELEIEDPEAVPGCRSVGDTRSREAVMSRFTSGKRLDLTMP